MRSLQSLLMTGTLSINKDTTGGGVGPVEYCLI